VNGEGDSADLLCLFGLSYLIQMLREVWLRREAGTWGKVEFTISNHRSDCGRFTTPISGNKSPADINRDQDICAQ
jgi:hypothetical protein